MEDEYRELMVAARDALGDLLRSTQSGTGLLLHQAYAQIRDELDADAREQEPLREVQRREEAGRQAALAVLDPWKRTPRAERQHRVLNALGERFLPPLDPGMLKVPEMRGPTSGINQPARP